jgi:hypothetical protein
LGRQPVRRNARSTRRNGALRWLARRNAWNSSGVMIRVRPRAAGLT